MALFNLDIGTQKKKMSFSKKLWDCGEIMPNP